MACYFTHGGLGGAFGFLAGLGFDGALGFGAFLGAFGLGGGFGCCIPGGKASPCEGNAKPGLKLKTMSAASARMKFFIVPEFGVKIGKTVIIFWYF
jgi:hypothetical protein